MPVEERFLLNPCYTFSRAKINVYLIYDTLQISFSIHC